jgi:hypothetical protein
MHFNQEALLKARSVALVLVGALMLIAYLLSR